MTSPFDIEEIFPDDAAGSVRLPRRQAGSSPQGMAVTLLADYTLRTLAWVPSAAIVALLAESGVSHAGARTAISRLARRGVLEGSRQGRRSSYRLTQPAALDLSLGGGWIASTTETQPWDEQWTLIAFSLPQKEDTQRRALREHLRWSGYAPLYDGLWISPYELSRKTQAQLAQFPAGSTTVFRAQHVELNATAGREPINAWDIAAIARSYAAFIRRWSPLLPRIRSGEVNGAEAVRARTEVMDTYRRFFILDPQLPLRLLPAGWLREPARDVFAAVYDGLAQAAEQHVRTVVARFADGPATDIQAHSIADMLTGVRRAACVEEPADGRGQSGSTAAILRVAGSSGKP